MMLHPCLQRSARTNGSGAQLLASGHHEEALARFADAFRTVEAMRNAMEESLFLREASTNPYIFLTTTTSQEQDHRSTTQPQQQLLFPVTCPSTTTPAAGGSFRSANTIDENEGHYIFEKSLVFHANALPSSGGDVLSSSSYVHLYRPTLNLLLAACAFNMALSFHQSSRSFSVKMKTSAQRIALHLYNTVIESLMDGWNDILDISSNSSSRNDLDMERTCLLAIALNNKAILCHGITEYEQCDAARTSLLLMLNVLVSSNSQCNLLSNKDIISLYRNGFLMIPPTIARAA